MKAPLTHRSTGEVKSFDCHCCCAEAFFCCISKALKSIIIVVCVTIVRSVRCSKRSDEEFVRCSFLSGDFFVTWVSGVQSKGSV